MKAWDGAWHGRSLVGGGMGQQYIMIQDLLRNSGLTPDMRAHFFHKVSVEKRAQMSQAKEGANNKKVEMTSVAHSVWSLVGKKR